MQEILFEYEINPTTWVYISSLMIIGIYFKFHRLLSVRNLDLIGLIMISPGLLLLAHDKQQFGYVWLFAIGAFFLVRLLLDPVMVRRPLLEPNLSPSGLTFTCAALFMFLMMNVVTGKYVTDEFPTAAPADLVVVEEAPPGGDVVPERVGPGYPPFRLLASFRDKTLDAVDKENTQQVRQVLRQIALCRCAAILGQLLVAIGMVLIGYRHFDNVGTGVAAATLYLLLPYTAQMTAHVDHAVPAAFLVWTVVWYRRPMIAGWLLGLAAGFVFYPFFLLPLWWGFYWRRGLIRFTIGATLALGLLVALLLTSPAELGAFGTQLRQTFGWMNPLQANLAGFWEYHEPAFRLTVMVAFGSLAASLALWPAQKNLGTLLSCSAAVMLGTQFWHAQYGGIYMAWYLPLLLLTVFRPNLEDRVAISALPETGLRWRWFRHAAVDTAA